MKDRQTKENYRPLNIFELVFNMKDLEMTTYCHI